MSAREPLLLAIESSCDETGVALVVGGRRILAQAVASQIALHAPAGGIVPELAARAHLRWVVPALAEVLKTAGVTIPEVDGIAVTAGPGLAGSLLVGIAFAKTLAWAHELPLVGVNHLEGHLYAAWLLDPGEPERPVPPFPLVALVVSGGHTFLAYSERRVDSIPAGPFYGGGFGYFGGYGYFGGFPATVIERSCETTFEVVDGRAIGWSLRGNAC